MHTRTRIRQTVFVLLVAGLIGLMGLVALPHKVGSAAQGETTAEITPEVTAPIALTAQSVLSAPPEVLSRTALVARAWMIARGAGKVDAESPADLDASLGVYTTAGALNLFEGGPGKPGRGEKDTGYYERPVFIMPITGNDFKAFGGPPLPPHIPPTNYTTIVVILFADTGDYHGQWLIPEGGSVPDLRVLIDFNTSSTPEGFISYPKQLATQYALTPQPTSKPTPLPREILADRALMIAQSAGEVDIQWGKAITASFGVYSTIAAWHEFTGEADTLTEQAQRWLFVMPFTGDNFKPVSEETPADAQPIHYTGYIVVLFADDGTLYAEKLIAEGEPLPDFDALCALSGPLILNDGYGE